jgi:hypothetical protein
MEALNEKVKELMVNQNHILEAVKYLHDRLEDDPEKKNSDAMVDGRCYHCK